MTDSTDHSVTKRITFIAAVVVALATVVIAWQGCTNLKTDPISQQGISVFIADEAGNPIKDLIIVFSDLSHLEPNVDGIVHVPHLRIGSSASIRHRQTRREIRKIQISNIPGETQSIFLNAAELEAK